MKLILFDIDVTLIKSTNSLDGKQFPYSIKKILKKEIQLNFDTGGMTDLGIIKKMLNGNLPKEIDKIKKEIVNYFINNVKKEDLNLLPGVLNLIKKLNNNHILGLGTGNVEGIAWRKMELLKIKDYFKIGSFGGDFEVRSDMIKNARQKLKSITNEEIDLIVIGDTVRDIKAAKEANAKVIAVATGRQSKEELKKENPNYIFENLKNTKKIIEVLEKI